MIIMLCEILDCLTGSWTTNDMLILDRILVSDASMSCTTGKNTMQRSTLVKQRHMALKYNGVDHPRKWQARISNDHLVCGTASSGKNRRTKRALKLESSGSDPNTEAELDYTVRVYIASRLRNKPYT